MEYMATVDEPASRDAAEHIAKAIANGPRLQLLETLAQGERSVEALAREASASVSTVSAQLQVLRRAGLVRSRRDGTSIFYRMAGSEVARLLVALNELARSRVPERIVLADQAAATPADPVQVPVIDAASVTSQMLVLDVRPALEFDAGHFPGAISIPMADLPTRWDTVPTDRYVVVYCRSGWCETARQAAGFLRAQGIDAAAMDEGVVEWRAGRTVQLGGTD